MDYIISPTHSLNGSIHIPASKSQTLRALLFASLANGISKIDNPLHSTDFQAMRKACEQIGAKIQNTPTGLLIEGTNGKVLSPDDVIDAGNSGIVLRFISAIAALSHQPIVITGDDSIRNQRPMNELLDALNGLGVSARSTRNNGYAPLIIEGPIQSRKTKINGKDSQPVSALLILGCFEPLEIDVTDSGEIPWIKLTLGWLDFLHVPYEVSDFSSYKIGRHSGIKAFDYYVPGDMSSAAFPTAAAVITNSELTVTGLDFTDKQGDRRFFDILQEMGARLTINPEKKCIQVHPNSLLKGITVDINDCIDAICILAATACYAEGETRITNASIARSKECNRIACLVEELSKMGAEIQETDDGLLIRGKPLKGARVHSHHDHRMAMALSVAALGAEGKTVIEDTDCTSKTYPGFFKEMQKIGAIVDEYPS